MAWETRKGKRYFYLSQRLPDGRVRKKYYGSRFLAEIESIRLEERKSGRLMLERERQQVAELESLTREIVTSTTTLVDAHFYAAGFHNPQSRGWRRRHKMIDPADDEQQKESKPGNVQAPDASEPNLEELVSQARRGNGDAARQLRVILSDRPDLYRDRGQLATKTQVKWIHAITGQDLFERYLVLRSTAELRKSLIAEGNGTQMERLLVEQVICSFLQLNYHEGREAEAPARDLRIAKHRMDQIERASRRHIKSLGTLATVRMLTPVMKATEHKADSQQIKEAQCLAPVEVPTVKPPRKRTSAPKDRVRTPPDRSVGKPHESINRSSRTPATNQRRVNRHHGQHIESECSTAAECQLEHSV